MGSPSTRYAPWRIRRRRAPLSRPESWSLPAGLPFLGLAPPKPMSHRSSPSLPETRRATLPATPSWPMAAARSMRRDKETAMDGVERLLAIEEIKTLFARRLRYMDLGKWDRYGRSEEHTSESSH